MPLRKLLFLLLLLIALIPYQARAEEPPSGEIFSKDAPVEITADTISYDRDADTYHASGNVEITQTGTVLRSDTAVLDMRSGVATATGSVRFSDEGGNTLSGRDLTFNIKDKTAVLVNGRLFYRQDNVHLTGDSITKTGPESYAARRLTFTTCDCPPDEDPAWSFAASSAKVTVGEYLTGWNARFYVKGVPVLYSPYISIPVKRERQTGFLQPRPGYSRLRGFVLDTEFFWAISDNTDATFYLDVETERGLGKGLEYRYIRSVDSYGEIFFYQFQEEDIDRVRGFRQDVSNLDRPAEATNSRWRLKYQHTENIAGFNVRANLNMVSDDEYFIDFGKDSDERSLESVESNISVSRNWSVYSLVAQMRLFNNLLDENDATTLQRLPEVTFTNADQRLFGTPLYVSSEASFVNFYREEGLKGQRLDVHPRISLPMNPGGYFDFTPSIAPRATFWFTTGSPDADTYSDRFIYDLRADLTTTFVKIFHLGGPNLKALRHTIRPGVSYSYIPEAVQDDLPNLDSVDRIAPANSVTYSVNSTLTGKFMDKDGRPVYFDYLYLDLSQTYNLYEAQRKLTSPTDERRPFSEVNGEIIFRPTPSTAATAKGKFNVYENRFTSYDASFSASDARGDSISVSRRFVLDEGNYLEAALRGHVSRTVDLTYLQRYSFDESRSLESSYGLEYRHQCWNANLTYTERLEEKIIYLTFDLLGLGRVAGVQGQIDQQE